MPAIPCLRTTPLRRRLIYIGLLMLTIFGLIFGNGIVHLSWSLIHWKAYVWAMGYWCASSADPPVDDHNKHLVFIMVDHFEPEKGDKGVGFTKEWCDKFRRISNANRDSYSNRFRYTWFYPYDHRNEGVMHELTTMCYEGFGEIEMHWHLLKADGLTNETFGDELSKAISWYQKFGAMITAEPTPHTAFAYIAGNWDLDGGRSGDIFPHITNQIEELFSHGCYADFTFSTIYTESQPAKVNSIYYVTDDPNLAKSYDDGADASVGTVVKDKLLIFEGPISIKWNGAMEYGAIEKDPRFNSGRIDEWIDANIHVNGRPEWVFVKTYSHGAQSAGTVLNEDMELMLKTLAEKCRQRGIKLHYMTAREAFNVVKAAESGEIGDPEAYRDFSIPKYRNTVVPLPSVMSDPADRHPIKVGQ